VIKRMGWGQRKVLWLANLALFVLLGYLLSGFILDLQEGQRHVSPPSPAQNHSRPPSEPEAPPPVSQKDIHDLLQGDLFGTAKAVPPEPETRPKKVTPEPKAAVLAPLQLKLLGTVAGDRDLARAVIEDSKNRQQDLYKTGDVVQDASIKSIERNRVVLMRNGVEEVLEVYLAGRGPSGGAQKPLSPTQGAASAIRPLAIPREAVKVVSPSEFVIDRNALLARIGGIEAIFKSTKLTPYVVEGKTEGMQLTGLQGISMARFVGLENGDVIQIVNGQKLTSPQKAFQVMQKAREQTTLNIQLRRGSGTKKLSF